MANFKKFNKLDKIISETDVTNFEYEYTIPENLYTEEFKENLKEQIKNAFLKQKLYKGYNEVINQIKLHSPLKIYMCGPLDKEYDLALKLLLKNVAKKYVIQFLSDRFVSLVHDSISTVNVRNTKNLPRRYFNTRIFAILQDAV